MRVLTSVCLLLLLSACAGMPGLGKKGAENATGATYTPVALAQLPGWSGDNLQGFGDSLRQSCGVMLKKTPTQTIAPASVAGTAQAWQNACRNLPVSNDTMAWRTYLQQNFMPYKIDTAMGDEGLLTGYYEASLNGARKKDATHSIPLYKRPPELVMVELGDFRPNLKGQRIAGEVHDGKLKPYFTRAQIDQGALLGRDLELAWVDNATDAFFLAVQGSGRVQLADGTMVRVGYDGQNGHPYTAIGKELIARGALTKDNVSMQTIRAWLQAHPNEATALMQQNASYVFFKDLGSEAAKGAQGIPLTATRSIAVDPRFLPYGAPVWISVADAQLGGLHRLVVAQDTGGAITGPVRGDFFWGFGAQAAERAGVMKARGQMFVLLPNGVKPQTVTLPPTM